MAHQINRRAALTGVAAAPALAALSAVPTSVGEDAELRRLWDAWNAQWLRLEQASRLYNDLQEKVFEARRPRWECDGNIGCFMTPDVPYSARFTAYDNGKQITKDIPLPGATDLGSAYKLAKVKEAERAERSAKRRYRYGAAERGEDEAGNKLMEIEEQIAEAPAEGYKGIAIKLAPYMFFEYGINGERLTASIYEAAVRLSDGVDIVAEIKRW